MAQPGRWGGWPDYCFASAKQGVSRMDPIQHVRKRPSTLVLAAMFALLPGCRIVGDVFKAGLWVGIVAAGFLLGLVAGVAGLIPRAFPARPPFPSLRPPD